MTDKELTQKHYEAINEDEIANELLSKVPKQVLADKHTQITVEERRRFAKEILEWAFNENYVPASKSNRGNLWQRRLTEYKSVEQWNNSFFTTDQLISEFEKQSL